MSFSAILLVPRTRERNRTSKDTFRALYEERRAKVIMLYYFIRMQLDINLETYVTLYDSKFIYC